MSTGSSWRKGVLSRVADADECEPLPWPEELAERLRAPVGEVGDALWSLVEEGLVDISWHRPALHDEVVREGPRRWTTDTRADVALREWLRTLAAGAASGTPLPEPEALARRRGVEAGAVLRQIRWLDEHGFATVGFIKAPVETRRMLRRRLERVDAGISLGTVAEVRARLRVPIRTLEHVLDELERAGRIEVVRYHEGRVIKRAAPRVTKVAAVAERLRGRLLDWEPGTHLPAARTFAEELDTSPQTVNRALHVLAADDLVFSTRRGWYRSGGLRALLLDLTPGGRLPGARRLAARYGVSTSAISSQLASLVAAGLVLRREVDTAGRALSELHAIAGDADGGDRLGSRTELRDELHVGAKVLEWALRECHRTLEVRDAGVYKRREPLSDAPESLPRPAPIVVYVKAPVRLAWDVSQAGADAVAAYGETTLRRWLAEAQRADVSFERLGAVLWYPADGREGIALTESELGSWQVVGVGKRVEVLDRPNLQSLLTARSDPMYGGS